MSRLYQILAVVWGGASALVIHHHHHHQHGRRRSTVRATAEAVKAEVRVERSKRAALCASPIGIGSCAPESIVSNDDLAEMVDTSDEWIAQRTGISSRRVLAHDETLAKIAATAAARALENADVDPSTVDLVIVATSSPDDLFGDATAVAAAIGARNAVAFDITAACSGFLFALVTGSQFLHSGAYETAVVVGADALSRWVDWDDRGTCILFGDGAGAVVLANSGAPDLLGYELKSNGLDRQHLQLPYAGDERPIRRMSVSTGGYAPITMNGREVYKFATREVPSVIKAALSNAGIGPQDVDWLLLHQANIRIMETVADRLGLPFDKVLTNLAEHGNTSAGSIPLALDAAVKSGQVKPGDVIACAGFGAGLSWGAAIIRWNGPAISP
ncbi:hypothetical protein CTAYLR_008492 [Chrysophaeum taylorii]|uniref:beta-ketoacyl-[acyl-carrier-protein] synthase III n=1 Tax=Chrysophaeum taylorii TaxID=2483200 RepID=A0AAD7UAR1_9STRA|nr:hypothetical protein CTAYLR_008492 [Chrysophaeum taylorii]